MVKIDTIDLLNWPLFQNRLVKLLNVVNILDFHFILLLLRHPQQDPHGNRPDE